INSYSLDDYRSQVGWVSQDVFLFSASLRENLAFHSNVTDAEIWEALEIVQLKRWAENLPDRLGEIFKERASSLSSGQRQLLSLARAILRQPKILIFDEATSALDNQTEQEVSEAIDSLSDADKTIFIIAHRITTLKNCDRIYELDNGKISGVYQYQELLEKVL
ncbi:MAG TPA: ATP-binding cassette domain-containing protein, partial [Saprospiraceae bacterium]|nr:ATP-binding cassette domain-containing protein [Saprospiraceae bacterium]